MGNVGAAAIACDSASAIAQELFAVTGEDKAGDQHAGIIKTKKTTSHPIIHTSARSQQHHHLPLDYNNMEILETTLQTMNKFL